MTKVFHFQQLILLSLVHIQQILSVNGGGVWMLSTHLRTRFKWFSIKIEEFKSL